MVNQKRLREDHVVIQGIMEKYHDHYQELRSKRRGYVQKGSHFCYVFVTFLLRFCSLTFNNGIISNNYKWNNDKKSYDASIKSNIV